MSRSAALKRKTRETDITLKFNVDGLGEGKIDTGIGFFDHMLGSFSRHGLFDLDVNCNGDLFVDGHHTVEDIGIVLGEAILQAIGDKKGMKRYGSVMLPMDDALILCALDLSGRAYYAFDANFTVSNLGYFDTELVEEFFRAVAHGAKMNLHIKQISGKNNHHIVEAIFKAFGKALDEATQIDGRFQEVLSTKGSL